MIYGKVEDLLKYDLPPKVVEFLKILCDKVLTGYYELGDGIYANVEFYTTLNHEDCKFEAHENYIDIQIVIEGSERIDCTPIKNLKVEIPYNPDKDIVFYGNCDKKDSLYLSQCQEFAIFYPEDAHKPKMKAFKLSEQVKKAVIKIPVGLLEI